MPTWPNNIALVQQNEAVAPGVTNRPTLQLAERTEYIKDRLDAAAVGEGLVLRSQPISGAPSEGDAVYYDIDLQAFAPALANTRDVNGSLRTADSAYVAGLVQRKLSDVAADILVNGYGNGLIPLDDTNTPLEPGYYYLSASAPGKLTQTRPMVGVFVCTVTSAGVIVNPTPREALEEHVHQLFTLVTDPSGVISCGPSVVTFSSSDNTQEGWLPVDDAIFGGLAPSSAYFGYNLTKNATLIAHWPPQPLSSAYLEINGVGVDPALYLVDGNGLWWLSNNKNTAPWDVGECTASPAARFMRLWFTRLTAKTEQSVVTGLSADAPITVTGCTDPDHAGYQRGLTHLSLNMSWVRTANTTGAEVVKTIANNGDLGVGYVVEGVKGAGLMTVTGTQTLDSGYKSGRVIVTGVDPTQITRQLDVSLIDLNGATESTYQDIIPYVGLPAGRPTNFVGRVRIPDIDMTTPKVKLDITYAMPTLGTPPSGATIAYILVDAPTVVNDPVGSPTLGSLPTVWSATTALNLNNVGSCAAGKYFARTALTVAVTSNQVLLFKLSRTGSDGYAGELAVLNIVATLYDEG